MMVLATAVNWVVKSGKTLAAMTALMTVGMRVDLKVEKRAEI